jgi:anaerobic glycerol-3-phosphate dehydrogenase
MDSIETHLQRLSEQMVKHPRSSVPVADVIDMLLDAQNYVDSLAMPFDGDSLTKILNGLKNI